MHYILNCMVIQIIIHAILPIDKNERREEHEKMEKRVMRSIINDYDW